MNETIRSKIAQLHDIFRNKSVEIRITDMSKDELRAALETVKHLRADTCKNLQT